MHQEYLCHKDDKFGGALCLKGQLTYDNDISYTIDTFETFYPKTTLKKSGSFIVFHLIPCFLGALLVCLDIWKDMELTNELDHRRTNDTKQELGTNFGLAFQISVASQFLHLFTSMPMWMWKMRGLWKSKKLHQLWSNTIHREDNKDAEELDSLMDSTTQTTHEQKDSSTSSKTQSSGKDPNQLDQISEGDTESLNQRKVSSPSEISETSEENIGLIEQTKTVLASFFKFVLHAFPLFPIVVTPLTMIICLLSGVSLILSLAWTSNIFSITLILGLGFARMITTWHLIFGEEGAKAEHKEQLHLLERQFVLTAIGESCLEATVQLGLQIWLLSQESFAAELNNGFIWSAIQIVGSLIGSEKHATTFQIQLVMKLFLSCSSLIFSVSGSYRHLKNQSMALYHLGFVILSLNCQLWARMSVIFAWCLHVEFPAERKLLGVALFLGMNVLIAVILKAITWKRNPGHSNFRFQNVMTSVLGVVASSLLLVRIPKVRNKNDIVPKRSFELQLFYLISSFAFNIIWTFLSRHFSNNPKTLSGTFLEIASLFLFGCLFQVCYYTVFGHPWKLIIQERVWEFVQLKKSPNARK